MRKDNLLKLAAYLDTLPDDYASFAMQTFFGLSAYELAPEMTEREYALKNGGVGACGAVACAVGHGPSAGFLFPEDLLDHLGCHAVNWSGYTDRFFIEDYADASGDDLATAQFEWMFSSGWSHCDNTPKGAAKRIRWLVNGGDLMTATEWWDEEAQEWQPRGPYRDLMPLYQDS